MSDINDDKSYYEKLCDVDIIYRLKPLLDNGSLYLKPPNTSDGVPKFEYRRVIPHNVPWIYVGRHKENKCFLWSEMFFTYFKDIMRQPPLGCVGCWKVVVKPRTLEELFLLEKLECEMNVPCKCGIEVRPYVHGLYGGYFYNRSKEEGLDKLDMVREAVHSQINPNIPVLLKHGCTEMEIHFGDGDKWQEDLDMYEFEKSLYDMFENDGSMDIKQPDIIKNHVHRRWVDFAYMNGDPTYKLFTNGKNLSIDYVTFEREVENDG